MGGGPRPNVQNIQMPVNVPNQRPPPQMPPVQQQQPPPYMMMNGGMAGGLGSMANVREDAMMMDEDPLPVKNGGMMGMMNGGMGGNRNNKEEVKDEGKMMIQGAGRGG